MPLLRLILQKRQVGYRNVFLHTNKSYNKHHLLQSSLRRCSSEPPRVSIGDVTVTARKPSSLTMVPRGYARNNNDQSTLHHLRWLLQKLELKQDVYLLGPAGPRRRNIAMALCQLLQSEVEYVAISRDTTEADLKQRREIQKGQAIYIDQAVVRAALSGRILILEGLEKAERNVLPVLNSLLEGREMPLSDGRFLMAHTRYDQLKEKYGEEELSKWGLVRVHEEFQVIALGLPVPRYRGNPLDPPLRSRFQARNVPPVTYQEQVDTILEANTNTNPGELKHILSWAYTFTTEEWKKLSIPDFPMDNLKHLFTVLNLSPTIEKDALLHRVYPWSNIIQKDSAKPIEESLKTYDLATTHRKLKRVDEVQMTSGSDTANVTIDRQKLIVPCGRGDGALSQGEFIRTPYLDNILAELVQSHSAHDFCLVGPRGCGKSLLVRELAQMLGYEIEPVILYQDMTSRDLLQQRSTSETGDTTWLFASIVTAAIQGKLAVLDGLHRVHHSTLSVLHRLVHDRELQLFDGTRLLRHDRYDSLKEEMGVPDAELAEKGVYRIHPAFRIAALAEPPAQGAQSWLGPEMVSLFLYHIMRPQSEAEVCSILQNKFGEDIKNRLVPALRLTERLSASSDNALQSISSSLSLRQLMRIGRTMQNTSMDLYSLVWEACLARFMPPLVSEALKSNMEEAGILEKTNVESKGSSSTPSWEVTESSLRIGNTTVAVQSSENQAKIPHTLFFDIDQHVSTLEGLLRDFTAGEHLLLIGNQGVGKNKLTDRLLFLLNRPREYLQLHRDTTIGNLTVQPSVREGRIVYEDSPLVQAVRQGHVLVLDEADKASTHVTCIIKTLLESGEMVLADGRRIVPRGSGAGLIPIHPEFRMIVLANRPGFPFLGNDFFGVMGDMFACHVIDNPTKESEISLLNQYGADVPKEILEPLVAAFSELRSLADSRMLHYPYSTREAVAIVKHLQKYPEDGILEAAKNVFDFDVYNAEVLDVIRSTFLKHGLPFGTKKFTIELARDIPLPAPRLYGQWSFLKDGKRTTFQVEPIIDELAVKQIIETVTSTKPLDKVEVRSDSFSEVQRHWTLPIGDYGRVTNIAITKPPKDGEHGEDIIHILEGYPSFLISFNPNHDTLKVTQLRNIARLALTPSLFSTRLIALGGEMTGKVLCMEQKNEVLFLVDPKTAKVVHLNAPGARNIVPQRLMIGARSEPKKALEVTGAEDSSLVVFWRSGGGRVDFVDTLTLKSWTYNLDLELSSVHYIGAHDKWLLVDKVGKKYLLSRDEGSTTYNALQEMHDNSYLGRITAVSHSPLSDSQLSDALHHKTSAPNRLVLPSHDRSLATLSVGFPELQLSDTELYDFGRPEGVEVTSPSNPAIFHDHGIIIRTIGADSKLPDDSQRLPDSLEGYLEVADIPGRNVRYAPIYRTNADTEFRRGQDITHMAVGSQDQMVSVSSFGIVRMWQLIPYQISEALKKWREMTGTAKGRKKLQLNVERESGKDVTKPKHGKVDPSNAPHVGGNQWAGGTGGRDTAGLGGKGGPYRLDAGHTVHQVPDWEKEAVPLEVLEAAKEMAEAAFKERLKQIQMSKFDAEIYDHYAQNIKHQVTFLRSVISSLHAKGKERQWMRHQTSGELDDSKLVEGLTGDKSIFRRRSEKEPELGAPQMRPKHLRLLIDVSGSMYRFNGYDGRLDREAEAVLLLMEALEGYEEKIVYEVIGHSGDSPSIKMVKVDAPPKNEKERLAILQLMEAHSQFCWSGDHTLEALGQSVNELAEKEADETFLILLSDANLQRYGIRPSSLASVINKSDKVNVSTVFIGSLGDQAERLKKDLPAGKAFVCLDTKQLSHILQQIFTATVLGG